MSRCLRRSRGWKSPSTPSHSFTPLREEDLALVRRWLMEPHVRRWWDDGVYLPYPDAVIEEYRVAIRGEDPTYRYIAHLDDRAAGMFQHYRIADDDEYATALALAEDAVGVDLFIGEPDLLGRGNGPELLRAFLREVAFPFHRLDVCVIGPSVKNAAAIRAYAKAGFRPLREAVVRGEPDPEYLMRITRATLDTGSS